MPKSDKLKISKSEQDKKGDSFTKWISQNWLSLANLLLVGLVGIAGSEQSVFGRRRCLVVVSFRRKFLRRIVEHC